MKFFARGLGDDIDPGRCGILLVQEDEAGLSSFEEPYENLLELFIDEIKGFFKAFYFGIKNSC